ncbi:MAG: DUF3667 domain-containing protein [Flavobacteriales bacterium]|nr:DUF3667 domain-containing protein [Flavobacteriales bacterium]
MASSSDTNCLNCGAGLRDQYCSHCGQSAQVPKFTWRYVFQELPVSLFAWDKGFLYTAKQLFTRPGKTIAGYIAGERIRHFRPLPLLAFCAGTLGILGLNFGLSTSITDTPELQQSMKVVMDWINAHYVWLELALLPIMSLSTWLWFRKQGYNLVEHLIINCFLASQRLMLNIVLFPVLAFSPGKELVMGTGMLINAASFGLFLWAFVQLFGQKNVASTALRTIVAYAMAFILLGLLGGAVGSYLALTDRLNLG